MKKNNGTMSFIMGLLCAFLMVNGINNTQEPHLIWFGAFELLVVGFLLHPIIMSLWDITGKPFIKAFFNEND